MTDDWSLIMDDWWLITDDWWLMIDDWWLMSDEWWLMIDDKINTNMIWNGPHIVCPRGTPPGVIDILHFILYLYLFYHQSSTITHHSSIISHQSSVINHQLSIINHPWSMINHQSSLSCHKFFDIKNAHLQNIKKNERKKLSPEARKKRIAPQSL